MKLKSFLVKTFSIFADVQKKRVVRVFLFHAFLAIDIVSTRNNNSINLVL